MIRELSGDLLLSKADVIVHSVAPSDECQTGLSLSMRQEFPDMFKAFQDYSRALHPMPGDVWTWSGQGKNGPLKIVCLFTQQQALSKSEKPGPATLESASTALKNLRNVLKKVKAKSAALPMVGTGAGGLKWVDVKPLVDKHLSDLPTQVHVYTTVKKGVAAE